MPRVRLVWPSAGRFCTVLGLSPVEEVDGDWCCYGEVESDSVVDFVDCRGFDSFDVVE